MNRSLHDLYNRIRRSSFSVHSKRSWKRKPFRFRFDTIAGFGSWILYIVLFLYWGKTSGKTGLILFLGVYVLLFAISFYLLWKGARREEEASRLERRSKNPEIWFWGLLFRITCIFVFPVWEDDWARFLWDGFVTLETGTPYGKPPSLFFLESNLPAWSAEILSRINHPDVPTIYGPVLEVLFAVSAFCFPGSLFGLKIFYLGVETGFWFFLQKHIPKKEFRILYWCPLLVIETFAQAHPDFLGLLLMAGVSVLHSQKKNLGSGILLGLACGVKTFGWILFPFFLTDKTRIRFLFGFVSAFALPYLFFWSRGGVGGDGLLAFLQGWEFNASFYSLFKIPFAVFFSEPSLWAGVLCLGLWGIFGILNILSHKNGNTKAISNCFLWFFLFSPVVNSWYLLWALFHWVRYPILPGIIFLGAVPLSYISGRTLFAEGPQLQLYENPISVRILEYSLVFLGIVVQVIWQKAQNNKQ